MGGFDVGAPSGGHGKQKGLRRPKRRLGIRMDMTPMVDIAFLLLIFYMVSTIFAEPQAMEINLPPKEAEETEIKTKESELLTIRVDGKDRIFWSLGTKTPDTVSLSRLPTFLQEKIREIPGMMTVVKINKDARYSKMVEVLDRIELVEYRFRAAQEAAIERGELEKGSELFSYRFSMAPWTRLDTKMIAEATGEVTIEEGT